MKADKRSRACLLFCAVLTILLCWRWQRIFYLMCADYIRSDMPAHVGLALGHNDYSLASVIVRALWALLGEARGQTALSLVLTCNQVLCVFTLWLLLRQMFPALDKSLALLASLLAHVCGPWILPGQTEMYLGVYNGNVLHIVPGHGHKYYEKPDYQIMTNFPPFVPTPPQHPWMGLDRYQKAESLLAAATDNFDVDDCFSVLKEVSQTVCSTVISMVFDVTEKTVYWCFDRNYSRVENKKF